MSVGIPEEPVVPSVGAHRLRGPGDVLRAIVRWRVAFVAIAVTIPVLVMVFSSQGPRLFHASTLVELQQTGTSTGQLTPNVVAAQDANSQAELVGTPGIAALVDHALGRRHALAGIDAATRSERVRQLLSRLSVSAQQTTGFLSISASAPSARGAELLANLFAKEFAGVQRANAVNQVKAAITQAQKDLANVPRGDGYDRFQVTSQLDTLHALLALQNQAVQVVEPANSATRAPDSTPKTLGLGIAVGLIAAFAFVLIAAGVDRRIRTPADAEAAVGEPLLATMYNDSFSAAGFYDAPAVASGEMLRGWLRSCADTRELDSVIITSAAQGDGKTTVAAQLALSAARTGQRVVLVDADLRRPQICARLGLETAEVGLSDYLEERQSLGQILHRLTPTEDEHTQLWIIPAGAPPENPSELLDSERMLALLDELARLADLVVIDTPAALVVGDALPLLSAVSGVLCVARIGHSQRDGLRRLAEVVRRAGGSLLGVVATGVEQSAQGYYYTYSYRAHAHVNPRRGVRARLDWRRA